MQTFRCVAVSPSIESLTIFHSQRLRPSRVNTIPLLRIRQLMSYFNRPSIPLPTRPSRTTTCPLQLAHPSISTPFHTIPSSIWKLYQLNNTKIAKHPPDSFTFSPSTERLRHADDVRLWRLTLFSFAASRVVFDPVHLRDNQVQSEDVGPLRESIWVQ
jgi:hypothetical protein